MSTQKARVLASLTQSTLCATVLLSQRIPRGAARIAELRSDGWDIETRTCTQHYHHTRQVEYVLWNSPGILQPDVAQHATPPRSAATVARAAEHLAFVNDPVLGGLQ